MDSISKFPCIKAMISDLTIVLILIEDIIEFLFAYVAEFSF